MKPQVVDDQEKMETGFYSRLRREPKVIFGGYPTEDHFQHLKRIGVRYFIDLTTPYEKKRLPMYHDDSIIYVNFPIKDNFIPYNLDLFHEFIVWLVFTIGVMKEEELMYIHCKGGHGRSGMVVCCVLCARHSLSPETSIQETTISHHERPLLTEKWRTRQCPSNEIQRMFVHRICRGEKKLSFLSFQDMKPLLLSPASSCL